MFKSNFAVILSVCLICSSVSLTAGPVFGQNTNKEKSVAVSQNTALSGEFELAKKENTKENKSKKEKVSKKQKESEKETAFSKEEENKKTEEIKPADTDNKETILSKEENATDAAKNEVKETIVLPKEEKAEEIKTEKAAADTKETVLPKEEKSVIAETAETANEEKSNKEEEVPAEKAADDSSNKAAALPAVQKDNSAGPASDFDDYIAQAAFKEIYSGDDLSAKEKEMIMLVSLLSVGGNDDQMKKQIIKALNGGLEPEKIIAAFVQCTPHIGYPKVMNAVSIAKKVFSEQKINFKKK